MTPRRLRNSRATKPGLSVSLGLIIVFALVVGTSGGRSASSLKHPERVSGGPHGTYVVAAGIHKIKHVIVIQQENRSFDSYFATYPGAAGIPMKHGKPAVCEIDPATGSCVAPFVDHADVNGGGPHNVRNAVADVDGGKMDGFIGQAESGRKGCLNSHGPGMYEFVCAGCDGLSHRQRYPELLDLCQGFRAAGSHVRARRLLEPAGSPVPGVRMVGEMHPAQQSFELRQRHSWLDGLKAAGHAPAIYGGATRNERRSTPGRIWTYLLHRSGVSWGYYVVSGTEPDCRNDGGSAPARP